MELKGPLNPKHTVLFNCQMVINREDGQLAIVEHEGNRYLLSSLSNNIERLGRPLIPINPTGYLYIYELKRNMPIEKLEVEPSNKTLYKFIPGDTVNHKYIEILHPKAASLLFEYSKQFELNVIKCRSSTFIMDKFGNKLASIRGINPSKIRDILAEIQTKLDLFVFGTEVIEFSYAERHILLFHDAKTGSLYCPYHNSISIKSKLYKALVDYSLTLGKQLNLIRILDIL